MPECVFCSLKSDPQRPVMAENDSFFAVRDKFPVNVGHTLLIPTRHVNRLRDLREQELPKLWELLRLVQERLEVQGAQGFNVGVNEGEVAGQTVPHLHVHVIPRYVGDVEVPRGGIRNLKKALIEY